MLTFYFATMQGGKSTALLQRRYNLLAIGKRVAVMTSAKDDRYGVGVVTSRMGPQCNALPFHDQHDFSMVDMHGFDELMIDEAQFCTPLQIKQLHELSWKHGVRVSCYGLRSDFRGEPFPGSAYLLALADEIHEISMLCRCGNKATLNQRVDQQGNPVLAGSVVEIGGDDRYRPVCRLCFR